MIFQWTSHKKKFTVEFFEFLDKKIRKSLRKYEAIPMVDYCVHLWAKDSLELLRGEAWYEEDGRHARKQRNYWKKFTAQGGTAPREISKAEMKNVLAGRDLFLSGEYTTLD